MLELEKTHMSIVIRDYAKFVPKTRAYKIWRNKNDDLVQEIKLVWKKEFGLLTPIVEEEEDDEKSELDNKEDMLNIA